MLGTLKDIAGFINENDDFAVITHFKPDGDAYGSEEKLSIRIIGSEVWYISTVSGESTSFAAQCSPKELETLLAAVREDERPPASPSPSAQPSPTPAPTTTPDPYLGTPEPEPANQK